MKPPKTCSVLLAGDLEIAVGLLKSGICLRGVTDRKSRRRFLQSDAPLLTLTARRTGGDELLTVSSGGGRERVSASVMETVGTFTLSDHVFLPGVTVALTALLLRDRGEWTVQLHSENPSYTLYACDSPILSFRTCSRTKGFFPYGCGEVYPATRTFSSRQNYPSYGASMQYLAVWHTGVCRGIYYGLHDPAPAYKQLEYRKAEGDSVACLTSMPLRNIDRAGNSRTLEGSAVRQGFDGDWYDAAQFYRAFCEQSASWLPERRDGKRTDTPEWLRTNPHWWRKRMLWGTSFAGELLEAEEDLRLSTVSPVHLYDWFQIPYDTNYPHYFPAKEAFLPGLRRLQVWDADHAIPQRASAGHARPEPGGLDVRLHRPAELHENAGRQAVFGGLPDQRHRARHHVPLDGPLAGDARETGRTTVQRMRGRRDFPRPDRCSTALPLREDRTHSHRPGGETRWVESYRNLLDHVRRTLPDGVYTPQGDLTEPARIENGILTATLPPLSVSQIIL